jgi:glyoxylase-like metal-dependent hydrolase (beta-lactamase superfamily II)
MTALRLPAGMTVFERGWLSSNNVFFDDGASSWLVDSGYATHAAQTVELVESKMASRPLNFLINTHLHSDHCGGNSALQSRYPELETVIPPGQAQMVSSWDPAGLFYTPTGQICPRFDFRDTLKIGASLQLGHQTWQVHSAGGHDPHAVMLFEPVEKVLISGDALWENGFGVVFPELEGIDAFDDVGVTLSLIESLNPNIVIPGHGGVFEYSAQVLDRARQRLDAFVTDPIKHARHAAKVLIKFKLLDSRRQLFSDLACWAATTSCLRHYQTHFFGTTDFNTWFEKMCAELIKSGVAKRDGDYILNG